MSSALTSTRAAFGRVAAATRYVENPGRRIILALRIPCDSCSQFDSLPRTHLLPRRQAFCVILGRKFANCSASLAARSEALTTKVEGVVSKKKASASAAGRAAAARIENQVTRVVNQRCVRTQTHYYRYVDIASESFSQFDSLPVHTTSLTRSGFSQHGTYRSHRHHHTLADAAKESVPGGAPNARAGVVRGAGSDRVAVPRDCLEGREQPRRPGRQGSRGRKARSRGDYKERASGDGALDPDEQSGSGGGGFLLYVPLHYLYANLAHTYVDSLPLPISGEDWRRRR